MRILVVEDNPTMADGLCTGLTAEGFEVLVASDGPSGLDTALAGHFDAIVLDIMLPGMNGYDVCRSVRAAGLAVPILMLTTKAGEYDEADGLDVGADDYLRKPFAFVVLVARLRALIRRTGPDPASTTLGWGNVIFDPSGLQVQVCGRQVDFTGRERALLETFLRNRGQILSRSQLGDWVWGEEVASNVVDVYVGYVRRKLSAHGADVAIETARGLGYRLTVSAEAAGS